MSTPPFGYQFHEGRIIPEDEEQKTLQLIKEYRRRKPRPLSYGNIAAELNRMGTLNRGKYWNPTTLWYVYKREEKKLGGEGDSQ